MNRLIIIAGNMLTCFGNSMYVVALLVFITAVHPRPFNIGAIQAAAHLPILLFGVFGGILADRTQRPGIIAGTDMARGIFLLTAAVVLANFEIDNPLIVFLPLVFLNAVMQAFFSPAVMSYILDQKSGRVDLLSLRVGTGHLSSLAGQLLGAALYPTFGLIPLLLINSVCFFASGISEVFLKELPFHARQKKIHRLPPVRSFSVLIKDFLELNRRGAPVLLYPGMQAVNTLVLLNLPFFFTERLDLNAQFIGYGLASLLGGSILSGMVLGLSGLAIRVGNRSTQGAALVFAAVCIAAGAIRFDSGARLSLFMLFLFLVVAGACQGWIHLVTVHLVYWKGDEETAAGRQGLLESAAVAIVPVGYLLSVAAASLFPLDTPWLLWIAAGLSISIVGFGRCRRAGHWWSILVARNNR